MELHYIKNEFYRLSTFFEDDNNETIHKGLRIERIIGNVKLINIRTRLNIFPQPSKRFEDILAYLGQEHAGSLRAYAASLSGGAISGCVSPFAEVRNLD